MGLYPILADLGYFPVSELDNYGKYDGMLRLFGNIDIPGIDATTGSLGHGVGIACGYCIAAKRDKKPALTFVILSEGEMYEGSVWESALFASHNNLDNLTVILDRNRKIILGDTENLTRLEPVNRKWESFGWETYTVNGHSHDELLSALNAESIKPKVIIANTTKGKGISFMEGRSEWHYTNLNDRLIDIARKEL